MNVQQIAGQLQSLLATVRAAGGVIEVFLVIAAIIVAVFALVPQLAQWRRYALWGATGLLLLGEAGLAWFHLRLWQIAVVIDPGSGLLATRVAVPLWVESEKLYVWALAVAILGSLIVRQRDELLPGVMVMLAGLMASAALLGHPFTNPIPGFIGQYDGYLRAVASGVPQAAEGAFEGMLGSAQYYYNAWYMWIHPPLLFFSYACFTISFVATVLMIVKKHSSFETTAYRWARVGYLALTFGMLLGFPWAIMSWKGESWWWSGKVNMSIMLWMLYTAYLHARLYLRRKGMWRLVAFLAVLSFSILVLTYITTYVVPGAHSYAAPLGG